MWLEQHHLLQVHPLPQVISRLPEQCILSRDLTSTLCTDPLPLHFLQSPGDLLEPSLESLELATWTYHIWFNNLTHALWACGQHNATRTCTYMYTHTHIHKYAANYFVCMIYCISLKSCCGDILFRGPIWCGNNLRAAYLQRSTCMHVHIFNNKPICMHMLS